MALEHIFYTAFCDELTKQGVSAQTVGSIAGGVAGSFTPAGPIVGGTTGYLLGGYAGKAAGRLIRGGSGGTVMGGTAAKIATTPKTNIGK